MKERKVGGIFMIVPNLASLCKTISFGATDESRTRNPQSGNLMLYQLSYSSMIVATPNGVVNSSIKERKSLSASLGLTQDFPF